MIINPIQIFLAKRFAIIRRLTAIQTDARIRHISEVIQSIPTVKSFGWELPFFNLITSIREKECFQIKESQKLLALNATFYFCSPQISLFATFVVFRFTGGTLTIPLVFSTMSLFGVLQRSLGNNLIDKSIIRVTCLD